MVGVERAKNVDVLYMRGGKEMERITPFFLTEPMVDRARGFENTLPAEEGGSVGLFVPYRRLQETIPVEWE